MHQPKVEFAFTLLHGFSPVRPSQPQLVSALDYSTQAKARLSKLLTQVNRVMDSNLLFIDRNHALLAQIAQ
jgi:hypothetical protein